MFSIFSIRARRPWIHAWASSGVSATRSRLLRRPLNTRVKQQSAANSCARLCRTSDWCPSRTASTSLTETAKMSGQSHSGQSSQAAFIELFIEIVQGHAHYLKFLQEELDILVQLDWYATVAKSSCNLKCRCFFEERDLTFRNMAPAIMRWRFSLPWIPGQEEEKKTFNFLRLFMCLEDLLALFDGFEV